MAANTTSRLHWRQLWTPRALLILLLLLVMGNRPACDTRTPDLTCDTDIPITVLPGTCVSLDNPCDASGEWSRVDGLRLCDEPSGLFVQTKRARSGTTRELCAGASVPVLVDEPVEFVYVRPGSLGLGQYLVTTGTPFSVSASASPDTIDPGQSSQLDVAITGGTPPYSFDWSPATFLSATNISNPTATSDFTVTYTVQVTDFDGNITSDNVTVNVNTALKVTANPPVIDAGDSSQLSAVFSGAIPPVIYDWIPVGSLDDPGIQSPHASPIINTTYRVTATDSDGTSLQGQVTVTVSLTVIASATPDTIDAGQSSQLLAAVQGGEPPYSFTWAPNADLDADDVADPIATPAATTTYTVDVTDSSVATPQTSSDSVTVTVNPVGGDVLTACFTPAGGGPPTPALLPLDASCSDPGPNGPIVEYCWWFNWDEDDRAFLDIFPDFCTADTVAFLPPSEEETSRIVRLRVEDTVGARAEVIHTFFY